MRKVLIIAYYWPPAGGPGVQRWLKFLTYLPENGIEPILYIPKNPHYPIQDESLVEEIPRNLKIYSHEIREPYTLAKLVSSKKTKRISAGIIQQKKQSLLEKILLWVRGNFFIPDARISWVKPSITFLSEIITKEKIQTLVTTGPPHSLHLIGMELSKKFSLPWVADFRDPWTTIGYHNQMYLTPTAQRKHIAMEKMVLNTADHIVVTSLKTKKEFEGITNKPITVITNGFEENDFLNKVPLDEKFTISHIGSLLSGRNPEQLWKVLGELCRSHEDFNKDFSLQFAGVVSNDVLEGLQNYGLAEHLLLKGYVPHAESVALQQASQVLLLIEKNDEESQGIIPGKLFEYMAAKRPIVAIGPKNWDVRSIIKETGCGKVFTYSDYEELKDLILTYYTAYKNGSLEVNSIGVNQYSRRALTKKLAKLL